MLHRSPQAASKVLMDEDRESSLTTLKMQVLPSKFGKNEVARSPSDHKMFKISIPTRKSPSPKLTDDSLLVEEGEKANEYYV